MSTIDHVLVTMRFNMQFARRLVEDVPEEKMAFQPVAGMNHPAWILGHLTMPRLWMKELLKLDVVVPAEWVEKFNMGSKPVTDRAAYPSKAELLAALDETHRALEAGIRKLTDADLARENPSERMRKMLPQVGDMVVGLVTSHQAFHQGQLSAWRRACGMPAMF